MNIFAQEENILEKLRLEIRKTSQSYSNEVLELSSHVPSGGR